MVEQNEGPSSSPAPLEPITPASPSTSAAPSTIYRLFNGPKGIRSGWRFVLYILLFVAILFTLNVVIRFGLHPLHVKVKVWLLLIGEAAGFFSAAVAALIMSKIEHRSFGEYGLPPRLAFRKPFWTGIIWGLVSISILLLILRSLGAFYFGNLAIHGHRILEFAAFYGLLFLLVGFFEEFFFRGYVQFTLTQGMGFWPAAILLSLIFGGVHLNNQGEAILGALSAGLIGFFFCLTLRRTGTLWFAVGLHTAWDWGETYLYSVPDSGQMMPGHLLNSSFHGSHWITGGSVGPEGSILVFVVIGAMWLLFDRMYPQVKYPPEDVAVSAQPASLANEPRS